LVVILLIVIVFIVRFIWPSAETKCQTCPTLGPWSKCTQELVKTRTNYRCSEETNYACESYIEEKNCETEIRVKGDRGILEAVISPTIDESVKGIIKVEVLKVPEGTEVIKFIFAPQEVAIGAQMDISKVIIESDSSGTDGWKAFFDTTKVKNGLYKILIGSTYQGAPDENPWLDYTFLQVITDN